MATTEEQHQFALTAQKVLGAAARVDPVPPRWEDRAAGLNRELLAFTGSVPVIVELNAPGVRRSARSDVSTT